MHLNDKRRRRRHSATFKATAIAACGEPGASLAAVALDRQVNANLLRRWVKEAEAKSVVAKIVAADPPAPVPAFVPVRITAAKETMVAERPIRVHIRKGRSRITIEWPVAAAGSCAGWLRELLG
jgi:transposase